MSDAQSLNAPYHRQQYVDFRVVVYRLNIPGVVNLVINGQEVAYTWDVIFNADFGDEVYVTLAAALNDPNNSKAFSSFLLQYHTAIIEALKNADGSIMNANDLSKSKSQPYQEIDITPLVKSVNNTIELYDINQCVLTMFDPKFTDFKKLEVNRYAQVNRFSPIQLAQLARFKMREFDLVRVFAHSEVDVSPSDRAKVLSGFFSGGLNNQFLMNPVFTGVVNRVSRGNAAGKTSFMQVRALGLERMFSQSVTVFNDALAPVIANSLPTVDTLSDDFEVWDGRFGEQRADEIMLSLFGAYLGPRFLNDDKGSAVIGAPDLNYLFNKKLFDQSGSVRLVPMLPTIVLVHILKKKYGEPIIRFDDRINTVAAGVGNTSGYRFTHINNTANNSALLQPYLLRFRDSFSIYNGSYQSASEIFDTIRENTYMEIFEDRTGEFHFRFPRYNSMLGMTYINPSDVIDVRHDKSDSAIFSVDTAQPVMPGYGSMPGIDPKVYMDKLSILKFGLRKPHTVENPNCVSDEFASALANFTRDYYSMRDARRAVIVKLGDPRLNVGQMVLFKLSVSSVASDPSNPANSSEDVLAGYIVSISEELSVGGGYTQTLELGFVRPAAPIDSGSLVFGSATTWDIVNSNPYSVAAGGAFLGRGVTPEVLTANPRSDTDLSPFIYDVGYAKSRSSVAAFFRRVKSPDELAIIASHAPEIDRLAKLSSLASGKPVRGTRANLQASIESADADIARWKEVLALTAVRNTILQKFMASSGSPRNVSGNIGDVVPLKGVVYSTRKDLFLAGQTVEAALNAARIPYLSPTTAKSAYSGISIIVDKNGQISSLADVTLDKNILALCISFESLKRYVDDVYKTSFQKQGDYSFLELWAIYFGSQSEDAISSDIRNEAARTMGILAQGTNTLIADGNESIRSAIDLKAAYSTRAGAVDALKTAKADAVDTTPMPSTIPPIGQVS